jgi:hypothetical protein
MKWQPLEDPYIRHNTYTWHHATVKAYCLPLDKLSTNAENPTAGFPCTVAGTVNNDDEDDNEEGGGRSDREESQGERKVLDELLKGETPVFESQPLPYPKLERSNTFEGRQEDIPWQEIQFPPVVAANVVTITLVGKDNEQITGTGFYCCVHRVQLEGIPLTICPTWL